MLFSKIQPFLKKNIYRQEVRPNIITACDCSDEWVHFKQTQLSLRQEKTISQYKLYKKKSSFDISWSSCFDKTF